MDLQTIDAYESGADAIFARHTTFARERHHARLLKWLLLGEPTADVGSGSGADLAWLVSEGFPAVGYDPVPALRTFSIQHFPELDVRDASLPDLVAVLDQTYGNVVCSAVLMHLPDHSVARSIMNLARILRPGGRLLLTFRTSNNQQNREDDGRLFTPISRTMLESAFFDANLRLLDQRTNEDPTRPSVIWTAIAAEKASS